ncbi:BsuPI-related putative proteinase inhibitor [Neobacillus sp. FSL H8-0543]|uniref:BsuPI-related putative proteinase inhibitor n=1 Tax=Neobacillus sp. FSL H8-0543 TaxID=2954672 RepID=UPI00315887EB
MLNNKITIVLSTVVIIGLLTGCGKGANTNGSTGGVKSDLPPQEEIAAEFHSSITTKEENNSVVVTYKVKNISGKPKKLTFPSGLKADFIVYNLKGEKVKQYSDEVSSTQAIIELTLENNEEIINEFIISDLANGQYKIEVFLTAKEEEAKVVMDLFVESSLYSQGSGELVGQIDPHSIELIYEGSEESFQLSQEAIQQYPLLKEGNTVSFIFTESEIGQKTIEKFIIE